MTHQKATASIDLGSNTIRLLIAEPRAEGVPPWRVLDYHHVIARLGEGVRRRGILSEGGMARALAALRDLASRCQKFGIAPDSVHVVATAAVRQAGNGRAFCRMVREETGLSLRVLSGDEEAALALRGSCVVLESEVAADMVLFDIGGASTEFTRVSGGSVVSAISLPLGVIRLVEEGLRGDPPSPEDRALLRQIVEGELAAVDRAWARCGGGVPKFLVGTAGTVTTLAAIDLGMAVYDADVVNRHWMSRAALDAICEQLCAMTHDARAAHPAIEPGRADLIVAGAVMVEAILARWGYERLRCVDAGLLEGAWLAARDGSGREAP